jgi:3-deoxy-D-manno-octulosonic acid kinase
MAASKPPDDAGVPAGFVRHMIGPVELVCADYAADVVRGILAESTLFEYAEHHPTARALAGRGVAYAATLPANVERVVVRHNRHGGLFAPLTRDLFRPPTRAPYELRTSERLRRVGVPTPAIVGYAIYPAPLGCCRVDVMSREVPDSFDLSTLLVDRDEARRREAWFAARRLLDALSEVAARHHDLNVKNILLRHGADGGFDALVLDVDRVEFVSDSGEAAAANVARLMRSAKKWQMKHRAPITDEELLDVGDFLRTRQPASDPSTA